MPRRPSRLTDRLERIEQSRHVSWWRFTLTDGTTGSLPMLDMLKVMSEATAALNVPVAERRPLSASVLLVARMDITAADSMMEGAAGQLARAAVEGETYADPDPEQDGGSDAD
jgi:hypothetical protein